MHAEEKMTYETWPADPEKSTLEAKNKFLGFWFFLGGETVLFASLFATYLALNDKAWALPVLIIGLLVTFGSMFLRSVKDDHGFHIHKEELLEDDDKGVKA
jgi:heme/copper-type cytochrome/quinol oxidase subunit 3